MSVHSDCTVWVYIISGHYEYTLCAYSMSIKTDCRVWVYIVSARDECTVLVYCISVQYEYIMNMVVSVGVEFRVWL